jgi:hypothetical protein
MFEGLVSDLVMKICGDYIDGLDKDHLNISIWSGNLSYEFNFYWSAPTNKLASVYEIAKSMAYSQSSNFALSFTGKVKLEKVVLKSSAFDELGLPITVVTGSIEVIDFDIPWKSIQSSPVLITIKGLKAVLGPNTTEQGACIFSLSAHWIL